MAPGKYTFMQSNVIEVKMCIFLQEHRVLEITPPSRLRGDGRLPRGLKFLPPPLLPLRATPTRLLDAGPSPVRPSCSVRAESESGFRHRSVCVSCRVEHVAGAQGCWLGKRMAAGGRGGWPAGCRDRSTSYLSSLCGLPTHPPTYLPVYYLPVRLFSIELSTTCLPATYVPIYRYIYIYICTHI